MGQACRMSSPSARPCTSSSSSTSGPPDWPEGYGKLLRFPFGIADMKALKEYARELWQPDGTAAMINDEVTRHGFVQMKGTRCTSEMVGVHPVGGSGVRWSAQLWTDAQEWCIGQANCT